jgi:hypothetical protein
MEECAAAAATVSMFWESTNPWTGSGMPGRPRRRDLRRHLARTVQDAGHSGHPCAGLPKRGSASRTFFLLLLYRLLGPVRFIQNGVVDIMLSSSCLVRRHRDDLAIADDLVLPMKA